MNRAILFGRLGRDPQLRAKDPVAHFSLAVDESYTKDGVKVPRTSWFHIVAWDRLSEIASRYLQKGDQVLVEGRIELRQFDARDGSQRSIVQLIASRLEFGAKGRRATEASEAVAEADENPDDDLDRAFPDDEAAEFEK